MPSFARAFALALLVACGGASAPPSSPAAAPRATSPFCDATCWRQLALFLSETCQCKTEACANATRERMIVWVTTEVIDVKHLDGHQQEVELPIELAPYDAVDDACTDRFRPPPSPYRRRSFVDERGARASAR